MHCMTTLFTEHLYLQQHLFTPGVIEFTLYCAFQRHQTHFESVQEEQIKWERLPLPGNDIECSHFEACMGSIICQFPRVIYGTVNNDVVKGLQLETCE